MVDYDEVMISGVFHRVPHHLRVRHRSAVVGHRHRSGSFHLGHFRELCSFRFASDRSNGINPSGTRISGLFDYVAGYRRIVVHRMCIRHRADGCEASRGGGLRAAGDGLFVFFSGLSQVNVEIYEAGRNYQSACVENISVSRGACFKLI